MSSPGQYLKSSFEIFFSLEILFSPIFLLLHLLCPSPRTFETPIDITKTSTLRPRPYYYTTITMAAPSDLPKMQYRFLGRSGLQVSAISLGSWCVFSVFLLSSLVFVASCRSRLFGGVFCMERVDWASWNGMKRIQLS